jgi:hypothetical protein
LLVFALNVINTRAARRRGQLPTSREAGNASLWLGVACFVSADLLEGYPPLDIVALLAALACIGASAWLWYRTWTREREQERGR